MPLCSPFLACATHLRNFSLRLGSNTTAGVCTKESEGNYKRGSGGRVLEREKCFFWVFVLMGNIRCVERFYDSPNLRVGLCRNNKTAMFKCEREKDDICLIKFFVC